MSGDLQRPSESLVGEGSLLSSAFRDGERKLPMDQKKLSEIMHLQVVTANKTYSVDGREIMFLETPDYQALCLRKVCRTRRNCDLWWGRWLPR
ncbi:hypothetical protein BaRGS_00039648 [Batillaria attramentaria]|uniref:Uncharacterized protein n=1 Tax=Batillaria attramentaria TaxID=370345 RepID=A0ABD0J2P1_9CAEN